MSGLCQVHVPFAAEAGPGAGSRFGSHSAPGTSGQDSCEGAPLVLYPSVRHLTAVVLPHPSVSTKKLFRVLLVAKSLVTRMVLGTHPQTSVRLRPHSQQGVEATLAQILQPQGQPLPALSCCQIGANASYKRDKENLSFLMTQLSTPLRFSHTHPKNMSLPLQGRAPVMTPCLPGQHQ